MNDYNKERSSSSSMARFIPCIVPENWDQTPAIVQSWDERLLDEDIVRIMNIIHADPRPGRLFAVQHKEDAENYFSKPYPRIAIERFGYKK